MGWSVLNRKKTCIFYVIQNHNQKEIQQLNSITEQLVKRNINSLRNQFNESQTSGVLDVSVRQKDRYESIQNRKAEDFVRKMQQQSKKHEELLIYKRNIQNKMEVRSVQQKKSHEEEAKVQKREMVIKRIQKRKEKQSIETEHKKKVHSEYLKFISSANIKNPLYKEMQEKMEKLQVEQQKIKLKKMKEIMN